MFGPGGPPERGLSHYYGSDLTPFAARSNDASSSEKMHHFKFLLVKLYIQKNRFSFFHYSSFYFEKTYYYVNRSQFLLLKRRNIYVIRQQNING